MTDNDPALTAAWNHGYVAGYTTGFADQQRVIDGALRLENKPGAHKEHLIEALRPELTPEQLADLARVKTFRASVDAAIGDAR